MLFINFGVANNARKSFGGVNSLRIEAVMDIMNNSLLEYWVAAFEHLPSHY